MFVSRIKLYWSSYWLLLEVNAPEECYDDRQRVSFERFNSANKATPFFFPQLSCQQDFDRRKRKPCSPSSTFSLRSSSPRLWLASRMASPLLLRLLFKLQPPRLPRLQPNLQPKRLPKRLPKRQPKRQPKLQPRGNLFRRRLRVALPAPLFLTPLLKYAQQLKRESTRKLILGASQAVRRIFLTFF